MRLCCIHGAELDELLGTIAGMLGGVKSGGAAPGAPFFAPAAAGLPVPITCRLTPGATRFGS